MRLSKTVTQQAYFISPVSESVPKNDRCSTTTTVFSYVKDLTEKQQLKLFDIPASI
jgi:hypothetical protein